LATGSGALIAGHQRLDMVNPLIQRDTLCSRQKNGQIKFVRPCVHGQMPLTDVRVFPDTTGQSSNEEASFNRSTSLRRSHYVPIGLLPNYSNAILPILEGAGWDWQTKLVQNECGQNLRPFARAGAKIGGISVGTYASHISVSI
jgi:hypothetical protein